jgi:glycerophosphoryl diester phosphodiesterase
MGCHGVEFDVMLSADGVPLLFHDETLERTTRGQGYVARLTAAQIRSFDAGGPHHHAFAVSPAPTFEEAMACCAELGLWSNIELKPAAGHESATGTLVGQWLARYWKGHGVVSSFSETALCAAQTAAPTLPFALLLEALPPDWASRLARTRTIALHLAADQIDDNAVKQLQHTPWACYTVNHRADAERLFALGCRAVFTDRPDLWQASEM